MPFLGTTQVDCLQGTLPIEQFPVAAAQTLKQGDLVYLNAGEVTLAVAASNNLSSTSNSSAGILGVMAQDATTLAQGTLVNVVPLGDTIVLTLPTYTTGSTAPAKTNVCSGANTTGFVLRNDSGIWKLNLDVTANPVARIYNLEMTDARKDARSYKSAGAVGDRVRCKVLAAVRQTG